MHFYIYIVDKAFIYSILYSYLQTKISSIKLPLSFKNKLLFSICKEFDALLLLPFFKISISFI